jgi:dUTP pyrophosphatase
MHLLIKPQNDDIKSLYLNHNTYHEGDAGLDIFCPDDIIIPAKSLGKINLGISCEALQNDRIDGVSYYMYPRSSIIKTPLRLANSVGIIDKGYRGNLIGCFDNISDEDYLVEKGTRLLQLCASNLEPITFNLVEELSTTSRGTGGYGSTGI